MITLDIDLSYLAKRFEINSQRINQYAGKSIEEVVEIEASKGNKKATGINDVVNNPSELAELLQLTDARNRFLIIKNLNDDDLEKLLEFLGPNDLIWGLQYFSVDKLAELISELPQEELLKFVLDRFGMDEIVALMKTDEMDKFLTDGEVEREDIMKFFAQMNEEQFKQFMVQILGPQALEADRETSMNQMQNFNDNDFKRAMKSFDAKSKMVLTYGLLYNKPEYLKELKGETLARPFEYLEKEKVIECMSSLDPKFLIPMVQELPKDLMQVIVTQVDPQIFADFLGENFSDILSEIAL